MFGYPELDEFPPRRRVQSRLSTADFAPQRRPPERPVRYRSRSAVRGLPMERQLTAARRVYDLPSSGQKARLNIGRIAMIDRLTGVDRVPAMSDQAVPNRKSLAIAAAKATAADRRFYHPEGSHQAPATLYGTPAKFGVAALALHNQMRDVMRFYRSLTVLPCVQRAARREVLFATGQHGAHHSKRRKGPFSAIRC